MCWVPYFLVQSKTLHCMAGGRSVAVAHHLLRAFLELLKADFPLYSQLEIRDGTKD